MRSDSALICTQCKHIVTSLGCMDISGNNLAHNMPTCIYRRFITLMGISHSWVTVGTPILPSPIYTPRNLLGFFVAFWTPLCFFHFVEWKKMSLWKCIPALFDLRVIITKLSLYQYKEKSKSCLKIKKTGRRPILFSVDFGLCSESVHIYGGFGKISKSF